MSKKSDSEQLELLVTKIQTSLAPSAEVTHDARLIGRSSNRQRQIDVLVRERIGQYEMLIVIDCKDHARPIDVKGVEEFYGLVSDVGAHRGVLVCPTGFSKSAKKRANDLQIDIYSPVDTDPHKWQARPTAPCVVDYRSAAISVRLSGSAPKPLALPYDFMTTLTVFDEHNDPLGTMIASAFANWFAGKYPIDPGIHQDLPIFQDSVTLVDNGHGDKIEVQLSASARVTKRLYFGQVLISKVSGFRDEQSGAVITNAFETLLDADDVEENWEVVESIDDLPVQPLMIVQGLVAHQLP